MWARRQDRGGAVEREASVCAWGTGKPGHDGAGGWRVGGVPGTRQEGRGAAGGRGGGHQLLPPAEAEVGSA